LTDFLHENSKIAFFLSINAFHPATRPNDVKFLSFLDALLRSGIDIDDVSCGIDALFLFLLTTDDLWQTVKRRQAKIARTLEIRSADTDIYGRGWQFDLWRQFPSLRTGLSIRLQGEAHADS